MAQVKNEAMEILIGLQELGIPWVNSKLITAQGMFESANFSSNVFQQNNNAYGMKMPSIRKSPYIIGHGTPAPQNEGYGSYAKYRTPLDSALDAVHLYNYNGAKWGDIDTPEKFAVWLKAKSYYGANVGDYTAGVAKYFDMLSDIIEPVTVSASKKKVLKGILIFAVSFAGLIILFISLTKFKRRGKRKY